MRLASRTLHLTIVVASVATGGPGCASPPPDAPCVPGACLDKPSFIPATYAALSSGVSATCAEQRAEPVFHMESTIVSAPPDIAVVPAPRVDVRWEITENFLVAREAGDPCTPGATPIRALLRVSSHFGRLFRAPDGSVRTDGDLPIDPSTPRPPPWFLRRYLAIDWSRNHVSSGIVRTMASGPVTLDPQAFFAPEGDPQAPLFRCGGSPCGDLSETASSRADEIVLHHRFIALDVPTTRGAIEPAVELLVRTRFWRDR